MPTPAPDITKAHITDAGIARQLMGVALQYVESGLDVAREVEADTTWVLGIRWGSDKQFTDSAKSALEAAKRWCNDALALLPAQSSSALTAHQRDKTWAAYVSARDTMDLVRKLAGDDYDWLQAFKDAAREVVGTVATTAGEIVGGVADIAGTAAGKAAGGAFKNLGWGALVLGGIVGVALVVRRYAS